MLFIFILFLFLVHRITRPLVILDLNGILLYREYDSKRTDADRRLGRFSIWIQSGLSYFLSQLFLNYDVAIWTSMQEHNTKEMIKLLFTDSQIDKFIFIKNQSHCIELKEKGFYPDKPDRPLFVKKIPWYWFIRYPRVYIVDDDLAKIVFNPVESIINVPSWTPENTSFTLEHLLRKLEYKDENNTFF